MKITRRMIITPRAIRPTAMSDFWSMAPNLIAGKANDLGILKSVVAAALAAAAVGAI